MMNFWIHGKCWCARDHFFLFLSFNFPFIQELNPELHSCSLWFFSKIGVNTHKWKKKINFSNSSYFFFNTCVNSDLQEAISNSNQTIYEDISRFIQLKYYANEFFLPVAVVTAGISEFKSLKFQKFDYFHDFYHYKKILIFFTVFIISWILIVIKILCNFFFFPRL